VAQDGAIYKMTMIQPYTICEYELQFSGVPIWCKVDASTDEIRNALATGLLRNVGVDKIRLFTVGESEHMVYDIKAALSGQGTAWNVEQEGQQYDLDS
jgi:hypothetical protein